MAVWLPAQIFILYGLMIRKHTDWIKNSLETSSIFALTGGFKLLDFEALPFLEHFNYSISITESIGYSSLIMISLWCMYGILTFFHITFFKNIKLIKIFMMYLRYLIISIQICLIPNMAYCSMKSLTYFSLDSSSTVSSIGINVCLGLLVHVYLIGFMVIIFVLSKRNKPNIIMILSETSVGYVEDLEKLMVLANHVKGITDGVQSGNDNDGVHDLGKK